MSGYVMGYMLDPRPHVAFEAEVLLGETPPRDQVHLTCGHWTKRWHRYCPHCGALIIEADPDDELAQGYIKRYLEMVKRAEVPNQEKEAQR